MKQLGIVSIIFIWVGLIFLIRKWKGNVSMTFSQHAAQHKASQVYYLILFSTMLPMFALFIYRWFIPTFKLPLLFGIFVGVGMIGNFIAALVPETKGKNVTIHRFSAFTMAACLIPLMFIIALSPNFPIFVRVFATFVGIYQTIGSVILTINKGYHQRILPLQAVYVAIFHITIIAATYIK